MHRFRLIPHHGGGAGTAAFGVFFERFDLMADGCSCDVKFVGGCLEAVVARGCFKANKRSHWWKVIRAFRQI